MGRRGRFAMTCMLGGGGTASMGKLAWIILEKFVVVNVRELGAER